MPIAKKPTTTTKENTFIAGAGKSDATDPKPLATTLRFKREFLQRIDAAAQRRNITRSAWIKSTLSLVLEQEELG